MSIIANWDDVSPSTTGGGGSMADTAGIFGRGRTGSSQSWGFQRVPSAAIAVGAAMPAHVVSCLVTVPNRGSSPQINIGGIGYFVEGSSVDAAPVTCAVFDARDSPTGTSSTLFQIRQGTLNTAGVVAASPSDSNVVPGRVYRLEHVIQPGATDVLNVTARYYDHASGVLLKSLTSTVSVAGVSTIYPGYLTYGGAVIDSIQLQVGAEEYQSNLPVKARIGGNWVRKPMKRWNGSAWVTHYPKKLFKGAWVW
ncbi:hypothetical protein I5U01_16245 [Stenotrophomonas maltophilia]|nr:hypothetical protein [Stenotrophomonas maltophilia]